MSNHFSSEQFAGSFVKGCTDAELQHLKECRECSTELDRLENTISGFRSAIRNRIDDRINAQEFETFSAPATTAGPKWHRALATAAILLLGMLSFLTSERKTRELTEETTAQASANALMDAVNLHVSGTIPSPMEPVMFLIPAEGSTTKSGGAQ